MKVEVHENLIFVTISQTNSLNLQNVDFFAPIDIC